MGLLNEIIQWVNMIGGSIIVAGVIGCIVAFYYLKVKKIAAREERVNTSSFQRTDATSYVPIMDVLYKGGLDTDGIIAINDVTFVGGLSVRGFDYPSASNRERVDAQVNSQAFFNVVEDAITFRQSVKGIDLSSNIEDYEKVVKQLATRLMTLDSDYQSTLGTAEAAAQDDPDAFAFYEGHLQELQRQITSVNHQIDECRAVIGYMSAMMKDSGKQGCGQKSSQLLFSYQFDPSQYSQELTREQIYLKAQEALAAKARTYSEALAFCHFRATRLTCRELILLFRKHNCPISGEDSRLEDLLNSSYSSLFVSSDSLVEAQKDLIGEEEYEARLARYETELEEIVRRQQGDLEGYAQTLDQVSYQKGYEELHGEGATV